MTSKNSFFKLLMEDLKRRIWTIGLACLAFFVFFPIACTIVATQEVISVDENEWLINDLLRIMGPGYIGIIFITLVAAVICGLSGFFYLHSRKKIDLYHGIPVRREKLFLVNYINGLLIYLVPYIFNVVLCFIVLKLTGYMSVKIFLTALLGIADNFLFYCIIYTITIIASVLTGNIIVSFLGTGVLLLYGTGISELKVLCFEQFFDHYFMIRRGLEVKPLFIDIITVYRDTVTKHSHSANRIILLIIAIAVLIGISIFLYIKRPSEAAGKAMAFELSKPIIKFLIVIPASIAGGTYFLDLGDNESIVWFVFGTIFLLILSCAIIEIIYNFDIRKAFQNKKQLLGYAVAVAFISITLKFDLLNYDSYIPKKNQIESMSVAIGGMDDCINYYELGKTDPCGMDNVSCQLKYMELKDFDPAYKLAELGTENSKNLKIVESVENLKNYFPYYVKYTLKSGRNIYRSYYLSLDDCSDLVKEVYEDKEFKKIHYPIFNKLINEDMIEFISCENIINEKLFEVNINEAKQILNIYKEELNDLTFDEKINSKAVANISLEGEKSEFTLCDYLVYPSFSKTLAFLEAHGFDTEKKLEAKDIEEIFIVDDETYKKVSYSDKQKVKDIFANIKEINTGDSITEKNIRVDVKLKKQYQDEEWNRFVFKNKIPEFIKKDLKKAKVE